MIGTVNYGLPCLGLKAAAPVHGYEQFEDFQKN